MAAAYDAAGNVNPSFAADINNWIMAMNMQAALPAVQVSQLSAASSQITTDGITGIASAATAP